MGDEETDSSGGKKESFEVTETSKKIIRVITVTTYLFSVSMAAIMLSLYYLFFWNPTVQSGSERLVDPIQLHFSRLYFNVTKKEQWIVILSDGSREENDTPNTASRVKFLKHAVGRVSAKMSKISVSRGSANGTVGSEIKFAGNDKEKMYEPKHRRKLVRVLTVIAYLFSVSLAAIMLSLFYVFIYNPGKPPKDLAFSHSLTQTHIQVHQESLETVNDTYREEPRALPVMGVNNWIRKQSQVVTGNYTHFNHSNGF